MSTRPRSLYAQVLIATVIGIWLGHVYPETGARMKPLGDAFIKAIRMIVAPIIFCTVVAGIAGVGDMKTVGKGGVLALLYFEVVSTLALIAGLAGVNTARPGAGMNVNPATLDGWPGTPVMALVRPPRNGPIARQRISPATTLRS